MAGELRRLLCCVPSPDDLDGLVRALEPHADGDIAGQRGVLRLSYAGTEPSATYILLHDSASHELASGNSPRD